MQKIFYNANIITYDKNNVSAEAFLINDESIVLVGSNEEVLSMKTDDTEIIDLENKVVIPSFFDVNTNVYKMIEDNLKNANLEECIENNAEIDENYEKFDNYEVYKNEFLIIQEEYFSRGITTIFEMGLSAKEFTFWKKLSQAGELKLDVIGFITIVTDKDVMDNNCRSYRKYAKHFRLGGYYLKIDDDLSKKKAWISKPYKHEYGYAGYSTVVDEQLICLFKAALDEKKQIIVETNGDLALDQFLRSFEECLKDKKDSDKFRPIAKNCNFISKKHLIQMKNLEISPSFSIDDLKIHSDYYKKSLGFIRANKIQPIKMINDLQMHYLIHSNTNTIPNIFELATIATDRIFNNKKLVGQKHKISFQDAMYSFINYSAYFAFDLDFKGSIENGKKANFIVLDDTMDNIYSNKKFDCILRTFINGKEVFKK